MQLGPFATLDPQIPTARKIRLPGHINMLAILTKEKAVHKILKRVIVYEDIGLAEVA